MSNMFSRIVTAAGVIALGLVIAVGGADAPTQAASVDHGEPADSGLAPSSGLTPGVEALVDDLGAVIDDGDIGAVADVDGRPSGYASFVVRTGEPAVDLYWKGAVPARVAEIIAAHPEVRTEVHSVPWSLAELVAARDAAVRLLSSEAFEGVALQSVGPMADASGILVTLGDVSAARAEAARTAVVDATGVAVVLETGMRIMPAALTDVPAGS